MHTELIKHLYVQKLTLTSRTVSLFSSLYPTCSRILPHRHTLAQYRTLHTTRVSPFASAQYWPRSLYIAKSSTKKRSPGTERTAKAVFRL
eukprot:1545664-Rhodomonas_salina.3